MGAWPNCALWRLADAKHASSEPWSSPYTSIDPLRLSLLQLQLQLVSVKPTLI
jgi:hypothetical protein